MALFCCSSVFSAHAAWGALLDAFREGENPPLIICTGWSLARQSDSADGSSRYAGWPGQIEDAMREVCEEKYITFGSVSDLAADRQCYGWGTHKGVKWHPNDQGHVGYAQKIYEAAAPMLKVEEPRP